MDVDVDVDEIHEPMEEGEEEGVVACVRGNRCTCRLCVSDICK